LAFLLAASGQAAQYELRLPLQYDRYLPYSARSLGLAVPDHGPLAIFSWPNNSWQAERFQAAASAGWLSAGQSHVAIKNEPSEACPAAVAAALRLGNHCLAAGYRLAMEGGIEFPDIQHPAASDHARLALRQYMAGWSYSTSGQASIGAAVSIYRAGFDWSDAEGRIICREAQATGYNISAGIAVPLTLEWKLAAAVSTKSELKGTAEFIPDTASPQDLKLSGAVPGETKISLSYRPEDDMVFMAEAGLTGWNVVTQGYEGKFDLKFGLELRPLRFLTLRIGAFSLLSPLDEQERSLEPWLQNLYFLSAGAGLEWRGLRLDLAGATSRPLSGPGQNQKRLTIGFAFSR